MLPLAGVPDRVAVPSPLLTKVTPLGSVPDSVSVAFGFPVLVTVNVPALPSANVVLAAEVMDGGTPMATGLFEALAEGPVPTELTAATERL